MGASSMGTVARHKGDAVILSEQNEWEQAEIIRVATRKNKLSDLYWFIQMIRPAATNGQRRRWSPQELADYQKRRVNTATWPGLYTPVIPVAPDPEASRTAAILLSALFEGYNTDPALRFRPALCAEENLTNIHFYLYPDELHLVQPPTDYVCPHCAAISHDNRCPLCPQ